MANPTHRLSIYDDGSLAVEDSAAGEDYYLKSWLEMGKTLIGNAISNFAAVTLYGDPLLKSGGQTNWVMLEEREKALWQRVNNAPYGSTGWHYFIRPSATGSILIGMGNEDDSLDPCKWPCITISSKTAWDYEVDFKLYPRNRVRVLRWNTSRTGVLIEGIRKGMNYDLLSPATHPHLFPRVYCYYQNGTNPAHSVMADTPKGILYMPIHDPASGYKVSLGTTGLWLDARWLHSRVP